MPSIGKRLSRPFLLGTALATSGDRDRTKAGRVAASLVGERRGLRTTAQQPSDAIAGLEFFRSIHTNSSLLHGHLHRFGSISHPL
jgi:hypothetical protein